MRATLTRPWFLACALAALLCLLALARPLDHDESQYVAAAVLSARGYLPYRDYAYLQTPLQPLLFAPIAWIAGAWTWPALRVVNALLGAIAAGFVYRAARVGGADARSALIGTGLFAACDIFLFSVGTARNDALPAALLAAALPLVLRGMRGEATPRNAALAGLLLAAAAAAKVSYALPATAYGIVALIDRRHRPLWLALGALPVVILVGWLYALAPDAFVFDTLTFPSGAPAEYYHAIGKGWKLSGWTHIADILKFLALGPALAALWLIPRYRWKAGEGRALDWLLIAAFISALLPVPTWRQYLLPVLPILFVRLAIGWSAGAPGHFAKAALAIFVFAGLAPSTIALTSGGLALTEAMQQGHAIRATLDEAGVIDSVATLSPQFLAATGRLPDPRFATGPFYFRSQRLLGVNDERAGHLVSQARIDAGLAGAPVQAILIGGEGSWTSGDAGLDAVLERWAITRNYVRHDVPGGRFRLYVRPR